MSVKPRDLVVIFSGGAASVSGSGGGTDAFVLAAGAGVFSMAGIGAGLIDNEPGGSFTLAADTGVFSLTGDDMAPVVDAKLPADVGTFAMTGVAATLTDNEPGGSTTTLNPSDKNANVALSGGNLVLTASGQGGARSVASHSSGKYYCEVTYSGGGTAYDYGLGLANASYDLTTYAGNPDTNSVAIFTGDPVIYGFGSSTGVSDGTTINIDTVCMAVDLTNKRVWFRQAGGGNWNGSPTNDPATNTGGASISSFAGAVYALMFMNKQTAATPVATMNFGATAYVETPPSGFGNW
jgi:hypothetical protein